VAIISSLAILVVYNPAKILFAAAMFASWPLFGHYQQASLSSMPKCRNKSVSRAKTA
jgi:hypothetical protein